MKGSEIKDVLKRNGRQLKDVAEKMGTSLSNLSAGLSKDDVRTGLLESIVEASGLPLSAFYACQLGAAGISCNNNTNIAGNTNTSIVSADERLLELLKMRDEHMRVKEEQLSETIKQVTKAQEQMDRVLDYLGKK